MTIKYSTTVRNAKLDAIEATIGNAPVLKIFDGSTPANCAAADAGTALAILTLPSDWMLAASSGAKAKNGTWQDTSADNSGTADYFRIYESTATTCHIQGTVATSAADMIVDSITFTAGQAFTISSFVITDNNA